METEIKTSLPTKLVSLRKQKGLTQMELAEKLNVSRQAISRWEVGAAVPSTDNLRMLGDLYGVSVDYLLNDEISEVADIVNDPGVADYRENIKLSARNRVLLYLGIAVIVIGVLIAVIATRSHIQEDIKPIKNLETIVEDSYPTEIFSIK